eukprot:CAMPEP_0175142112 /NCGR_PEP_ID=MMETSP0087-20121206/12580_1 /TAXON_ID=136419 /ORGANISM="Unknown Unknown, Strain D1" /LENGTH=196 /DNA_ID=CAMNT_0016425803 /DNA_START=255 /DNA_END=845 /DNA_ORIENTATION=+
MSHMLSGTLNGQFLKMLVAMSRSKRVLEIGSYTGYTAVSMLEALPDSGELVCVDDFSDESPAEQIFDQVIAQHPKHKLVTVYKKGALAAFPDLIADVTANKAPPFDFVFIDADKQEQIDYVSTLLAPENKLLSEHASVVVDNTLWYSKVLPRLPGTKRHDKTTKCIDRFNKFVVADHRVDVVMLNVRDGLTIMRRR